MAHNIDMTNGRANMAFTGARADIWHGLGQAMQPGQSKADWMTAAGLNWTAVKVPAYAYTKSLAAGTFGDRIPELTVVEGSQFVVRSDNGHPLGYVSDRYQPVQPAEVLDWFEHYISQDSRFKMDTAGVLKSGEIIWAMASFDGASDVAGDKHKARLLMTTTFDGTGSTINKATMVRVVCNNTLDASLADGGKALIRTRHNTKFNADKVRQELGAIAQGFEKYKAMGEAMLNTEMQPEQISKFFKAVLDIPFDTPKHELSGKKQNAFQALKNAYGATVREGTPPLTAWSALNAVTHYVDHEKSTRGDARESRVLSANFGSGAQMKAHAVELLYANGQGGLADVLQLPVARAPEAAPRMGDGGALDALLSTSQPVAH